MPGKNRLAVAHAAVKHELRTIGDAGQQDINVDFFGSALQRPFLHVLSSYSKTQFLGMTAVIILGNFVSSFSLNADPYKNA